MTDERHGSRAARVLPTGSVRARSLSAFATLAAAALAATCGGQVRVDDDGSGGQGGSSTGAQQGSASQTVGPGSSVGPSTVNASATSSSTGDVGAGGASGCFSCAGYVNECIFSDSPQCVRWGPCEGLSADLFNALGECVCAVCALECVNVCAGMEGDPQCETCQMNAIGGRCSSPFVDCVNDV